MRVSPWWKQADAGVDVAERRLELGLDRRLITEILTDLPRAAVEDLARGDRGAAGLRGISVVEQRLDEVHRPLGGLGLSAGDVALMDRFVAGQKSGDGEAPT